MHTHILCRVEAGIMRQMVLWDTACNFNGFISNQSIFNCLIIGASTLYIHTHTNSCKILHFYFNPLQSLVPIIL